VNLCQYSGLTRLCQYLDGCLLSWTIRCTGIS
jgi:hypothetical protein